MLFWTSALVLPESSRVCTSSAETVEKMTEESDITAFAETTDKIITPDKAAEIICLNFIISPLMLKNYFFSYYTIFNITKHQQI